MATTAYFISIVTVLFGTVVQGQFSCTTGSTENCPTGYVCYLNQCYQDFGPCYGDNFTECAANEICALVNGSNECLGTVAATSIGTTATSYVSPGACQDRANNCVSLSYLCDNSVYYVLMTQMCARTCNRCDQVLPTAPAPMTSTTTSQCVDLHAPGRASDCSSRSYLCNNPVYYNLMTQQCPLTCNRCPGTNSQNNIPLSTCQDRTGLGGSSNCASVSYLCQNWLYRSLMAQQCPRTCGYC